MFCRLQYHVLFPDFSCKLQKISCLLTCLYFWSCFGNFVSCKYVPVYLHFCTVVSCLRECLEVAGKVANPDAFVYVVFYWKLNTSAYNFARTILQFAVQCLVSILFCKLQKISCLLTCLYFWSCIKKLQLVNMFPFTCMFVFLSFL